MHAAMIFILASASPRRRELLKQILPQFEVIPATGEEQVNMSLFPEQMACELAGHKCDEVFMRRPDAVVIGCDTIVVLGKEILGKPRSPEDAAATLKRLSGKTHYVITGVCVRSKFMRAVEYDRTEVRFNVLSDKFIEEYVKSGSPMDKAGSYGIQDGGLVKEYYGNYTNVVGLPLPLTKKLIQKVIGA